MNKNFTLNPNILADIKDNLDNPEYCIMRLGVETYPNSEKDLEIISEAHEVEDDFVETEYNKTRSRAERRRRTRNVSAKRLKIAKNFFCDELLSDPRCAGRIKGGSEALGNREWRFWADQDAETWLNRNQHPLDPDDSTAFENFLDREAALEHEEQSIHLYNKMEQLRVKYEDLHKLMIETNQEARRLFYAENDAYGEYLEAKYNYEHI